ncbi:MAG: hypothetical protein ACKVP7_27505 [Hyphomicrobiaceae bacterium]
MAAADVFTGLSAGMLVSTAAVHSVLGERRLIAPLLLRNDGVLAFPLARFLLRAVWHFMSITFVIIAIGLIASLRHPDLTATALLWGTAVGIGGAGLYDAVASRGQHIGWPMLVLIGLFAMLALLTRA